ncbi:TetR/AcrR family transcriptional regulator C-terminal domain-containing protein [Actinocorallia herbida]|nr:TetR/AcrR family transcriptional regulator C-terminal domain-containing protein [Actinocorallia herbida]
MPRETLTREQIVQAAVTLLDEAGIDGLSMRKLGQRLGSAATAMYWHVGSKENLVSLACDRVWSEVGAHDPAELGWREAARRHARDTYETLRGHTWVIAATGAYFVYGHGMARVQDASYAIYEAAGFTGWDLDWAVNAASTFAGGAALSDASLDPVKQRGDTAAMREALAEAGEIAASYPRLRARLEQQAGVDEAVFVEEKFDFGLEIILDGLEARLRAR